MIWTKTDAGRIEMQARALIKERAQRNLLLLIDGNKSEEMLLGNLAGISAVDFDALQSLGLIAPSSAPSQRSSGAAALRSGGATAPAHEADTPTADAEPLDYAQFTAALTRLISSELGLRGFVLTLAVE